MKPKTKNIISILILSISIAYLYHSKDIFTSLPHLRFQEIVNLYMIMLAFFIAISYQFKIMMLTFNVRLTFKEWFGLTICNTMYNYLLPARGGLWVRSLYLKKKHDFKIDNYIALLFFSNFILLVFSVVIGFLSIALDSYIYKRSNQELLYILLFLLIIVLTIVVLLKYMARIQFCSNYPKVSKFVSGTINGLDLLKKDKKIGIISILNILFIIISGLRFYYCLSIINASGDNLFLAVTIQSLACFSMIFSITPGNLGIKEGIIGVSSTMMNIPLDVAILAAVIDRAAAITFVFFFGIIYNNILLKKYSE